MSSNRSREGSQGQVGSRRAPPERLQPDLSEVLTSEGGVRHGQCRTAALRGFIQLGHLTCQVERRPHWPDGDSVGLASRFEHVAVAQGDRHVTDLVGLLGAEEW